MASHRGKKRKKKDDNPFFGMDLARGDADEMESLDIFKAEPSITKDVIGITSVGVGGFTLLGEFMQSPANIETEKVSLGLYEIGAGLMLTRNDRAQMTGRVVTAGALVYDLAAKLGLLRMIGIGS